MKAEYTIKFGELGYIAKPYWPEIEWLVMLEKKAGIHIKHGDEKKRMLLETYCSDNNIPMAQIDAARLKIETEKWYRRSTGEIFIPSHHIAACIVQALGTHPLKKVISKDQLRSFIVLSDLDITPRKTCKDGDYERYVKNPETNLRRLAIDEVISNFTATGTAEFAEDVVEDKQVESLISFAGRWVGVGSARKMGRGKFEVVSFGE